MFRERRKLRPETLKNRWRFERQHWPVPKQFKEEDEGDIINKNIAAAWRLKRLKGLKPKPVVISDDEEDVKDCELPLRCPDLHYLFQEPIKKFGKCYENQVIHSHRPISLTGMQKSSSKPPCSQDEKCTTTCTDDGPKTNDSVEIKEDPVVACLSPRAQSEASAQLEPNPCTSTSPEASSTEDTVDDDLAALLCSSDAKTFAGAPQALQQPPPGHSADFLTPTQSSLPTTTAKSPPDKLLCYGDGLSMPLCCSNAHTLTVNPETQLQSVSSRPLSEPSCFRVSSHKSSTTTSFSSNQLCYGDGLSAPLCYSNAHTLTIDPENCLQSVTTPSSEPACFHEPSHQSSTNAYSSSNQPCSGDGLSAPYSSANAATVTVDPTNNLQSLPTPSAFPPASSQRAYESSNNFSSSSNPIYCGKDLSAPLTHLNANTVTIHSYTNPQLLPTPSPAENPPREPSYESFTNASAFGNQLCNGDGLSETVCSFTAATSTINAKPFTQSFCAYLPGTPFFNPLYHSSPNVLISNKQVCLAENLPAPHSSSHSNIMTFNAPLPQQFAPLFNYNPDQLFFPSFPVLNKTVTSPLVAQNFAPVSTIAFQVYNQPRKRGQRAGRKVRENLEAIHARQQLQNYSQCQTEQILAAQALLF